MIITRTPYRISFFGGGTDYKKWYSQNGGAVLTTTIDKYCYINLREMPAFLGHKYLFLYSEFEKVDHIDDIKHPGIRGCLKYMNIDIGIEANHAGDMPARSGLGSSSAFTVGMLHALHTLKGEYCTKRSLANEAIEVEQNVLGETVGIQDQIQCSYGGLNYIKFDKDGSYIIDKIVLSDEKKKNMEDSMVLVFTGLQRYASEIAAAQVDNIDRKYKQLEQIAALVPIAVDVIVNGTIHEFGDLLHETWMLKRELSDKVSSPEIDKIYKTAIDNGAIGGKVLGAGGGGFMLFVVSPNKRQKMIDSLKLLTVPVKFENEGSQLILQ